MFNLNFLLKVMESATKKPASAVTRRKGLDQLLLRLLVEKIMVKLHFWILVLYETKSKNNHLNINYFVN
ncbi:hypothetical protein HMPREF1210_00316 [Paenisporosarcina sp. HGH0030]|nr:hypothetical protein HMPREF1210_00316 [Paenisporosarcina sp. HGH0030]